MAQNNIILATLSLISNGNYSSVEMSTTPDWKSKSAKKNKYLNRVVKHTRIGRVGLGLCYTNVVESHAERSGVDTRATPYIPNAPKGMHYPTDSEGNITTYRYLISDSNPNQYYLNVVYRGNESKDVTYYLDGIKVTDKEILEDIKAHINVPKECAKQREYGIASEDVVIVNRPKFQNIVSIRQGEIVYERGYVIESIAM